MDEKRYDAVNDEQVTVITNVVIVGTLMVFAGNIFMGDGTVNESQSLLYLLFPVLVMIWGVHPLHYSLTDYSIVIKRPFGSVTIPYKTIDDVKIIQIFELGVLMRMFGSGGLFGYLGLYHSSIMGRFMMWSSNKEDLILII